MGKNIDKTIVFENLFSKIKEIFLAANDLDILSIFNFKNKAENSWPEITHEKFKAIEENIKTENNTNIKEKDALKKMGKDYKELNKIVGETKDLFPRNTTLTNGGNKHMVGGGATYNKALMEKMVNRIQPKLNYVFEIWKGGGKGGGNASVNLLLTGLSGVGKSFLVLGNNNGRIDYEDNDNNTQNYTHGLLYEIIKEIQKLVNTEDTTEDTTKATHESNVTMQMKITLYSAFHGKKDSTGDCGIPVKLENENENINLSDNIKNIIPRIKNNLMKYEDINIKMNTINRAKKFGENIEEMGEKLDFEKLKGETLQDNRRTQIVPYILESRTKTTEKIENIQKKFKDSGVEPTEEEQIRIIHPEQRTMKGETLKDIAENNKGNEQSSRLQTVIELIITNTNPKINNKLRILIIDPAGTEHLAGEMPLIDPDGTEESVDGNLNDYNKLEQNKLTSYLVNEKKLMLASAIESHFINISLFYLNLLFLNQNMFDFYNYHDRIGSNWMVKNEKLNNFHYNIMPFSEFIYGIEKTNDEKTIYTGKTTINIHNTNKEKYYCLQSGNSNSKKG